MTRKMYHATNLDNTLKILEEGIKPGIDGVVYLAETQADAMKFAAIRTFGDIYVLEVEVEEDKLEETFDHSQIFFKCKAFGYEGIIEPGKINENVVRYLAYRTVVEDEKD